MDLSIISKSYRQFGRAITKNSPTILTALGAAGVVATVILAVKATPKAMLAINEAEIIKGDHDDLMFNPLTPAEIAEACWKLYIPTAAMGLTTIACIIGANHISMRRNAALASLFTITETALKEYQAKVVEQIGEKKEEKIREEIAKDHITENPIQPQAVILTGKGNYPCWDDFAKRWFTGDVEELRRAENRFNEKLNRDGYLSIDYFYDEIGCDPVPMGEEIGWIINKGLMKLTFYSMLNKQQEPCLVMNFLEGPTHI